MIFISKYIVPKRFVGITLFPFIFLKRKELRQQKTLINHEKIHLKQQLELLVLFFYLWYGLEWFLKLLKYKNTYIAYQNISFEREAYAFEEDFSYLKQRKFWSFLRFI